jgi:hypothetical protein
MADTTRETTRQTEGGAEGPALPIATALTTVEAQASRERTEQECEETDPSRERAIANLNPLNPARDA